MSSVSPRLTNYPDFATVNRKIVRHALGRAVAAVADVELYGPSGHASSSQAGTQPLAEWPELFPFLTTNTQAAAAEHREIAIFILHSILESVRDTFVEQMMDGLFNIFSVTLNDQSEDVRLMTLRALGKMAEFIDLDEKALIVSHSGCSYFGITDKRNSGSIPSAHTRHASSTASNYRFGQR